MASPTVVDADPQGDIVLICGNERVRIRASSHVLRLGSSTFNAMFRNTFKEGRALAETGSVEIDLPDDDGKAMIILCSIMHTKFDAKKETPTAAECADLARLADKYDMVRTISPMIFYWVTEVLSKNSNDLSIHGVLLGLAYSFGHAKLFEDIGDIIVMDCVAPAELAMEEWPELDNILNKLQEFRDEIERTASDNIEDFISAELDEAKFFRIGIDGCNCQYWAKKEHPLMHELKRLELWPVSKLRGKPLSEILSKAKGLDLEVNPLVALCVGTLCLPGRLQDMKRVADDFYQQAQVWDSDLFVCLECARKDEMELGKTCNHT